MRNLPLGLALPLLVLAACATPQYRAEKAVCRGEWLQKLPPDYQPRAVQRSRLVSRPTGEVTCTKILYSYNCTQLTELVDVPYTEIVTVDMNEDRRDAGIRVCTRARCIERYGNNACKVR